MKREKERARRKKGGEEKKKIGGYTAVFSVVTQRSWGGTLCDDTKNGYVADYYLEDGGVFGQKISCLTEEVYLAVTFSKIWLEIRGI